VLILLFLNTRRKVIDLKRTCWLRVLIRGCAFGLCGIICVRRRAVLCCIVYCLNLEILLLDPSDLTFCVVIGSYVC
jgi:hypothetical protein